MLPQVEISESPKRVGRRTDPAARGGRTGDGNRLGRPDWAMYRTRFLGHKFGLRSLA